MRLLTWNIQYGLGADGALDLVRIARTAQAFGRADLYCFQEIAVAFPEIDRGAGADQVAELAGHFPGFVPVFGPAVERPRPEGPGRRFGNLVLSRLPVLEAACHLLPRPADAAVQHMPRSALEVTVAWGGERLRVTTTHLEFHSQTQRLAQVARLLALQAEAEAEGAAPPRRGKPPYDAPPRSPAAIVCGDFNFPVDAPEYAAMTAAGAFRDAWGLCHGTAPHAPTCGLFDRDQWPQGPHARDFVFVSPDLAGRIAEVAVDTETAASDHQPVLLALAPSHLASGRHRPIPLS